MRISTSYVGMNEYYRLYRVDILFDDETACYFIENEKPKFIKPSDTYIISEHWYNNPRDETEAREIVKLVLKNS